MDLRRAPFRSGASVLLGMAVTVGGCAERSTPNPTEGAPTDSASPEPSSLSAAPGATSSSLTDVPWGSTVSTASELASQDTAEESSGGAAHDPSQRVKGRVIDFWEHPVPDVPVHIGESATTTDALGEFTVDGVTDKYNVSLAVRILGEVTEVYAWHYVGLTRRDPTLQVYKGLPQRTTPFTLAISGFDPAARWRGEVGVGGQHGQRSFPLGESVETVAGWRGPSEQTSPLRVLLWQTTEDAPSVPAEYLFTEATTVRLKEADAASVPIMLPSSPTPLPRFEVGFMTSNAPNTSHLATSYVRFDAGPSIQVAQVPRLSDSTDPFVLQVPQLIDASVTLAALSGNGANSTSFAVTYAPGIEASETVALTFPTVASLENPVDAATGVTLSTPFTWSETGGTFVMVLEDLAVYQSVFVVTAEASATVPDLEELGIYYPHDGPYRWTIESHGTAATLDELCGSGYLDPFSGDFLYPIGPRRGQGRFWRTEARTFKFE